MLHFVPGFVLTLSVLLRTGLGSIVIVEEGKRASIQATFTKDVKSVTWQQYSSFSIMYEPLNVTRNLATCSFEGNKCSDLAPPKYHGYVTTSGSSNTAGLNITDVIVYENTILCITDNGQTQTIELKAYVSPKKPVCTPSVNETHAWIKCTTDNVYPKVDAKIYRREADLTIGDFAVISQAVTVGIPGSGSDGDVEVTWTWWIPVYRMRTVNTFYVEMRAMIDKTVINKTVVVSDDIVVSFSVPEVVITRCPVGARIGGKSILNGTDATCTCEITSYGFPTGYAQWYNKDNKTVGILNPYTGSSTMTVSYNSTDPDQTYECRPVTILIANVSGVKYTPAFTSCLQTVDESKGTALQCYFPTNVTSVTWQLIGGAAPVNLTTCNFVNNNCSTPTSSIYSAYILPDGSDSAIGLNITSPRSNETHFSCLADNGQRVDTCELEIYGGPIIVEQGQSTNLQCNLNITAQSVTWQVLDGANTVNLTTCSFQDNTCTDLDPSVYQGHAESSANVKRTSLDVRSARTNETQFVCLSDNGQTDNPGSLEVYDWPSTPSCYLDQENAYIDVVCDINYFIGNLNAVIHRREVDLTSEDIETDYPKYGNDTTYIYYDDDVTEDVYTTVTWRIPFERLLPINVLYVEMSANISNMSMVNRIPAVSNNVIVIRKIPQVVVHASMCPVGSGVVGTSILIGTSATCKCEIKDQILLEFSANWYDKDNNIVGSNNLDGSSKLTVSYNSSDLDQAYECRPNIPLTPNVHVIKYIPVFTSCRQIVEKGHSANLHCKFPGFVSSVTWQILSGDAPVNLTTCSFVTNNCTASTSSLYSGYISSSGDNRDTGLNISSAQINETNFICVPDLGPRVDPCMLEVYERPEKPYCSQKYSYPYIEYSCITDTFYPDIDAFLYRKEVENPPTPIDVEYYRISQYNSATEYPEVIIWKVLISSMFVNNTVYAVVSAKVSHKTMINQTSAVSDDLSTTFTLPEVNVNASRCPYGSYVHGQDIRIGSDAYCRCDILVQSIPPSFARWYDKDNWKVGDENQNDGSSTLTVRYDESDPHPTYECRPVTVFQANVTGIRYSPVFVAAPASSQTAITGLQPLVVVMVALYAGLCSGYH